MLSCLLCMVALSGSSTAEEKLSVGMEVCPSTIRPGDVLFIRITLRNLGPEPLLLPERFGRQFGTLHYELTHTHSQYSFRWNSHFGSGTAGTAALLPGESRIVSYDILEFPPADHLLRDFWSELLELQRKPFLKATLRMGADWTHQVSSEGPKLLKRPEAEMVLLNGVFTQSTQLERERGALPEGLDATRPHPAHFGLSSLPANDEVAEPLLRAEPELSADTLHDVVHLSNVLRACYDCQSSPTQMRRVAELVNWIDQLPEIQRHAFAIEVVSWCANTAPWERPYFALAAAMIDRLPERCYGKEDYPGYWRRQLSGNCPPFAEFLKSVQRAS